MGTRVSPNKQSLCHAEVHLMPASGSYAPSPWLMFGGLGNINSPEAVILGAQNGTSTVAYADRPS